MVDSLMYAATKWNQQTPFKVWLSYCLFLRLGRPGLQSLETKFCRKDKKLDDVDPRIPDPLTTLELKDYYDNTIQRLKSLRRRYFEHWLLTGNYRETAEKFGVAKNCVWLQVQAVIKEVREREGLA